MFHPGAFHDWSWSDACNQAAKRVNRGDLRVAEDESNGNTDIKAGDKTSIKAGNRIDDKTGNAADGLQNRHQNKRAAGIKREAVISVIHCLSDCRKGATGNSLGLCHP